MEYKHRAFIRGGEAGTQELRGDTSSISKIENVNLWTVSWQPFEKFCKVLRIQKTLIDYSEDPARICEHLNSPANSS